MNINNVDGMLIFYLILAIYALIIVLMALPTMISMARKKDKKSALSEIHR